MSTLRILRAKLRFLIVLAVLMFITGLVYGVLSGSLATSSATESDASEHSTANSADSSSCLSDPSVLEEIRSQREAIATERKELEAKKQEIKEREQAISDELTKLQAVRDEIKQADDLHKQENQEKVAKIIDTLSTMSPKASAKMIANLDDNLAVEVMAQMDTKKLAKIMNLVDPKRASALTELMAGVTRARAGGQDLASADSVTGRDGARDSSRKGGENYDGQNYDSSNSFGNGTGGGNGSLRKPSSLGSQGGQ